jgi:SAM-dependent methyltransferase
VGDRTVGEFYDDAGIEWSLRSVGMHLHPGAEDATVELARRAEAAGLATGGRILDVASALGAPARYLARRFGARVVCIDMDGRMHERAVAVSRREGLGNLVQPLLARTERLPLAGGAMDAAWSQDALCHMDKDAALSEVARVLRPGAIFAFTDFVARRDITHTDLARVRQLWAFPSLFTVPGYVAALGRLGFEVLLAEDRTAAILGTQPRQRIDEDLWWEEFAGRWGGAKAEAQREAGLAWFDIVRGGRGGYAMFIARR